MPYRMNTPNINHLKPEVGDKQVKWMTCIIVFFFYAKAKVKRDF